jgi:hypothetical protein
MKSAQNNRILAMSKPSKSGQEAKADRLMRIGAILTVVGIGCSLVALLPLVIPGLELSSIWWGLSMITGVGFAILLFGLRASAKVRKQRTSL